MKTPKTPRGTWTFCGSTGVLFEDRLLNWCVTQRCNVWMAMRKHLCSWPGLTMLAVQIFWGKTLVYGGKQKPGWMIFWNLEHGHKNHFLLMVVFFSKDSKGLCSVVFFSEIWRHRFSISMCCTRKGEKKISECVATSNQFESESSIQIVIAESAKVLIPPEFFFTHLWIMILEASLNF